MGPILRAYAAQFPSSGSLPLAWLPAAASSTGGTPGMAAWEPCLSPSLMSSPIAFLPILSHRLAGLDIHPLGAEPLPIATGLIHGDDAANRQANEDHGHEVHTNVAVTLRFHSLSFARLVCRAGGGGRARRRRHAQDRVVLFLHVADPGVAGQQADHHKEEDRRCQTVGNGTQRSR